MVITVTVFLCSSCPAADPEVESPFGFHPARILVDGYAHNGFHDAETIGVKWHRRSIYFFWFLIQPDLDDPEYFYTFFDNQMIDVPPSLTILANIGPESSGIGDRCVPGTWIPIDIDEYIRFVHTTVERYDGDGIDDMPGLPVPIKYWQVGNEPDNTIKTDFAQLQRITYLAIKQVCPDCTVLCGGATGGFPSNYIDHFETWFAPILDDLDGRYIDVFDFHWYGSASGDYRLMDPAADESVLEHIRARLTEADFPEDIPIWITEMGTYSGDPTNLPDPYRFQSEREQAQDIFKRFIYPLSQKIGRIFCAFGLIEGFGGADGYFDHTGLIYDGLGSNDLGLGIRKLSYFTYWKMTEKLEGSDWSTLRMLHDGTDSDHMYLFSVKKDNQDIYIAWWDYYDESDYLPGDRKTMELCGLYSDEIQVTSVVPEANIGFWVGDYATAFHSDSYPVSNGCVSMTLSEDPVIIEQSLEKGVTITCATQSIHPGDTFWVKVYLTNPEQDAVIRPLFVCLYVYGCYYFWPGWTPYNPPEHYTIDYVNVDIPPGVSSIDVINPITWPDTGDQIGRDLYFFAALLNPEMTAFWGDYDTISFDYGP